MIATSAVNYFGAESYDTPLAGYDDILEGDCKDFSAYFESQSATGLHDDMARGAISTGKALRLIFSALGAEIQGGYADAHPSETELMRAKNGELLVKISSAWVRQNESSYAFGEIILPAIPFEMRTGVALKRFVCEVN